MHLCLDLVYSHRYLKKQERVMHSSTEVEYVSASEATKQNVWLRKILEDMGVEQDKVTILFCDYKSAIAMSKNSIFHNLMKHIHLKHHYIWEAIENDEILVKHIQTKKNQVVDIYTKHFQVRNLFI